MKKPQPPTSPEPRRISKHPSIRLALLCFFNLKHTRSIRGKYMYKSGDYFHNYKCIYCGSLLGFSHMTEEYALKRFPIPPKQPTLSS